MSLRKINLFHFHQGGTYPAPPFDKQPITCFVTADRGRQSCCSTKHMPGGSTARGHVHRRDARHY